MIAAIVAPAGFLSIATTRACLVSGPAADLDDAAAERFRVTGLAVFQAVDRVRSEGHASQLAGPMTIHPKRPDTPADWCRGAVCLVCLMMASVAFHKRVGLALAQRAMFERELPHVAVPELTRGASIQLNERVSLRREDEILSSAQSC
jgi:hypothetical protein